MSVLTPNDAKPYLNLPDNTRVTDTEIQTFIDAAEDKISELIGPLTPSTVTSLVPNTNGTLVLPYVSCPVISITSATNLYYKSTIPPTTFIIEPGNVLTLPFAYLAPGIWSVVYQAGWTTLPARARMAVLEQIRHLWKTQRAGSTGPDVPGSTHAVPWRVLELLGDLAGLGYA
ncbi:MAG: hypothetical protein HY829_10455 [Actinobacteria bacterium]|nr:hypothetical protein [Actinomycetota bacterium]